jgi:flagellar biosynthesis protein FlhF
MNVYKFKARTIDEATAKVKNELGPDALILSTKRLNEGGNNQQFEITAFLAGQENENVTNKELKNDLMGIMEMVYILNNSNGIVEKMALNPPILKLYAKLIRSGVNTAYAKTFMEKGGAFQDFSDNQTDKNVKMNVIKEIMKTIEVCNPLGERNSGRVISALIGTTGVGKTTTIAKIAAQLMLKSKKNVGLISIDNYRIGAIEQLKTYANILGIPCYPAFNRKDLLFALKRLSDKDVVLIDTAGQSQ